MSYLSLGLPGGQTIAAPKELPQGGLPFLGKVLGNFITLMIVLAVISVVIVIVWSGTQWIRSGGDKSKLQAARSRLTWAVVGLLIVLLAFFIINVIGYFFNVPLLKFK